MPDGRSRRWPAEAIALALAAARQPKHVRLLLGLDALGDQAERQAVAHADDCTDDRHGLHIERQAADEGLVDLDLVDWEAADIAERGIARTEIVERDLDT